ncbi:MAG: hypothetical protein JNM96_03010, partial [Bacteroidia bacterium]|nr:hypothetical protein [Bacteroidia bacterium]
MKKVSIILLSTMLTVGSVSGQSKFEKFFWSKKYKACLAERDGLCSDNKQLRKDTTDLGKSIRHKDSLYNTLST